LIVAICIIVIEFVANNLPTGKDSRTHGITIEFYQMLKKKITQSNTKKKPPQNIQAEKTLDISFYETSLVLIQNQTKIKQD
jgi:hypothetical protein